MAKMNIGMEPLKSSILNWIKKRHRRLNGGFQAADTENAKGAYQ